MEARIDDDPIERKTVSRRMLVGAGVLSLVIPAMVAGGPAGADDDPGARFQNTQAGPVDPAVQPPSLDTTPVTVMVEFDKDSVATAMANRGGKLSKSQKNAVKKAAKAQQNAAKGAIKARGGTVEGDLQAAINAVRVTIPKNKVDSLEEIKGVTGVLEVPEIELDNATSVPFLGVPQVWESRGYTGEGVKVGIIDTGIDYTHADFGGPGTVEAYEAARAADIEAGARRPWGEIVEDVRASAGRFRAEADALTGPAGESVVRTRTGTEVTGGVQTGEVVGRLDLVRGVAADVGVLGGGGGGRTGLRTTGGDVGDRATARIGERAHVRDLVGLRAVHRVEADDGVDVAGDPGGQRRRAPVGIRAASVGGPDPVGGAGREAAGLGGSGDHGAAELPGRPLVHLGGQVLPGQPHAIPVSCSAGRPRPRVAAAASARHLRGRSGSARAARRDRRSRPARSARRSRPAPRPPGRARAP